MLSSLQIRIAKLFLSLPEALNFALAGGAALVFKNEFEVDDNTFQELLVFFRNLRAELIEKANHPR